MRSRLPAFILVVLAVGASAGGSSAQPASGGFTVRTIARIQGNVLSFAHSDRFLAWITVRGDKCAMLFLRPTRGGARTVIRKTCDESGSIDPDALVLAGDRAYWEEWYGTNLTEYSQLITASARKPKVEEVDFQSIYNQGFDHLVPPVSDGRSVYFWSSPEDATPGPIVRYGPRGSRRMTRTISSLSALGAGEGRWAFAQAKRTYDCAQETAWSPAGQIAFASGGGRNCRGGIWVMNANGGAIRRVTASGRNPDWSQAGDLAYDDRGAVKVLSGSISPRVLVARGTNPAWSFDRRSIAFERDNAIVVADADGRAERVVATGAADPDWSPDGAQLVFRRTDTRKPGLGIVSVDGGNAWSLTTENDKHPSWSPDGRLIAFARCGASLAYCGSFGSQIHVVAPDGTGARARTEEGNETEDFAPSWASDSQRLVFARSRQYEDAGDSHIFTGDRALTRTPLPRTPVFVRSSSGRSLARYTPSAEAVELAVTRRLTAALTRGDRWRLELLRPRRHSVTVRNASVTYHDRVSAFSASGYRVILLAARKILLYDVRTQRLVVVARVAKPPIGLSIVGRRIAWAENVGRHARVRAVTLPR